MKYSEGKMYRDYASFMWVMSMIFIVMAMAIIIPSIVFFREQKAV